MTDVLVELADALLEQSSKLPRAIKDGIIVAILLLAFLKPAALRHAVDLWAHLETQTIMHRMQPLLDAAASATHTTAHVPG